MSGREELLELIRLYGAQRNRAATDHRARRYGTAGIHQRRAAETLAAIERLLPAPDKPEPVSPPPYRGFGAPTPTTPPAERARKQSKLARLLNGGTSLCRGMGPPPSAETYTIDIQQVDEGWDMLEAVDGSSNMLHYLTDIGLADFLKWAGVTVYRRSMFRVTIEVLP